MLRPYFGFFAYAPDPPAGLERRYRVSARRVYDGFQTIAVLVYTPCARGPPATRRAASAYGAVGFLSDRKGRTHRHVAVAAVMALTVIAFALRLAGIEQSVYGDERLLYNIVVGHGPRRRAGCGREHGEDPAAALPARLGSRAPRRADDLDFPPPVAGFRDRNGARSCTSSGRARCGRWPGVVAAGIVALAPFAIFYGIENRAYATLTFFSALSTLTLLSALRRNRPLCLDRVRSEHGVCALYPLHRHLRGPGAACLGALHLPGPGPSAAARAGGGSRGLPPVAAVVPHTAREQLG